MKQIDIEQLIPQRAPIRMVDELLKAEEHEGVCQFVIRQDNRFLEADGSLSAAGLVEHIAQSASTLCGYHALKRGCTTWVASRRDNPFTGSLATWN